MKVSDLRHGGHLFRGKWSLYPLHTIMDRPQYRSGHDGNEKNVNPLQNRTATFGRSVCRPVLLPTALRGWYFRFWTIQDRIL